MSAAVSEAVLDAAAKYLKAQYGASYGLDNPIDRQRILAALQEGSGALPASPSGGQWQRIETARAGHKVIINDPRWGVAEGLLFESGKWGLATFNGQIITAHPTHWMPLPDAPSIGILRQQNETHPLRSDILERIRAFDFGGHYTENDYERLADDLEALAQPNQPRDREGEEYETRLAYNPHSASGFGLVVEKKRAALSPKNTESE